MKDELDGKIMRKFVGLKAKAYSYLIDDASEDKNAKSTQKCVIKRELKFEISKNCLEATKGDKKINYLGGKKINIDSLQENQKEFIKNNKLLLQIQQRFKSESLNVFTEEIHKIALSSYDDKVMQSIDLTETYAHGTSKELVSK